MYVTLKAGKARTFNGLRIQNATDRPVKLRLEPGDRITEEQDQSQQDPCHCQDDGEND